MPKKSTSGKPKKKRTIVSAVNSSHLDTPDLNRLLSLRHSDPHSILGIHSNGGIETIRAFRPGADSVEVQIGKSRRTQMHKTHPAGLFECSFTRSENNVSYKLVVHEPGGFVK